jgi:DNA-binding transcriptional regulator LsrR (DeoR family)
MARPKSAPDLYLLSKVSMLYYLRHRTQQEIAVRLRLSRPAVSRLLQEAQNRGVVQITVHSPGGMHVSLEAELEDRFGLDLVQIVDVDPQQSPDTLRRQIGAAAASYLARIVEPHTAVGLSWGTTLSAMVQAMPARATADVRIVQTLGGIGPPNAEAYGADLVRRLARQLNATPVLLPAPGIVATPEARDALLRDPHVQSAVRRFDALDVVFVGIGSLRSNAILNDSHSLPRGTRKELIAGGATGDIALRFFDATGAPVHTSLDARTLGITLEQLGKAKRVVAVAGGADKMEAIYAALKTEIVDVLITDQVTAQALLAYTPRSRGKRA